MTIEGYFLFLIETINCDPSSEPYRRDGLDEGSQHISLCIGVGKFGILGGGGGGGGGQVGRGGREPDFSLTVN